MVSSVVAPAFRVVLILMVTLFLTVQSTCTFLMNLPPNYTTERFHDPIQWYMGSYFAQFWSLFAPNPGRWNPASTFRFAYIDAAGSFKTTPWFDGNSLFRRTNTVNPLDRTTLEREIYFGEMLLATNAIVTIRANVRNRSLDRAHPISLHSLPESMFSVERIFMSLAPAFIGKNARGHYLVQVALREENPMEFADAFPAPTSARENNREKAHTDKTIEKDPTLVIPWVVGEHPAALVDEVSN